MSRIRSRFHFRSGKKSGGAPPPPPFDPATLFAGTAGAFYDIADRATVFTDTAGTIQAVVGNSVARVNDKSGNGNHVIQATALNQPVLGRHPSGGRRNILTQTATLATQSQTVTAVQHTLSFRGTGTITLTGASTAGPLVGTGPADIVSLSFTPTAGSLTLTVSGTVEIAQLEIGAARSVYQSVNDAAGIDVTEVGKADVYYLAFDAADDGLSSSASSTQLIGPWEFWAKVNILAGGGIGQNLFSKSTSVATAVSAEGIFQRSDGVQRQIIAASRIGSGTTFSGTAGGAFVLNSPFTAKAIAAVGPDSLTAITPLASGAATTPNFTGTQTNNFWRIGPGTAGARFNFYSGFAIDRNLTGPEATSLDTWMDAQLNPL